MTASRKATSSTPVACAVPQHRPAFHDALTPVGYATRVPVVTAPASRLVVRSNVAAVPSNGCSATTSFGEEGTDVGTNNRYDRARPPTVSENTLSPPATPWGAALAGPVDDERDAVKTGTALGTGIATAATTRAAQRRSMLYIAPRQMGRSGIERPWSSDSCRSCTTGKPVSFLAPVQQVAASRQFHVAVTLPEAILAPYELSSIPNEPFHEPSVIGSRVR